MQTAIRYTTVSLIVVFAGLVATCDVLVVGLNYEEATFRINDYVFGGAIIIFFALVVAGIMKLSMTTGTTRGDCARAFVGLIVVGCLTPVLMVVLKLIDPGDGPQQDQVDAFFVLIIWSIGGIVAGGGLLGYRLCSRPNRENSDGRN